MSYIKFFGKLMLKWRFACKEFFRNSSQESYSWKSGSSSTGQREKHSQERASLSSAALITPHGCLEICQRVWIIIRYELSLDVSIDRKQFPGNAPLWVVNRQLLLTLPPTLPCSWNVWLWDRRQCTHCRRVGLYVKNQSFRATSMGVISTVMWHSS